MSDRIFISYRREDSSGYAGRLFDRLKATFGRERVFMDIEAIEPGSDFVESIDHEVGSCGLLIAVIGKQWLEASDEQGNRRLDNPNDFMRLEIASGLKRNVRVLPVLVRGAAMPQADDLPEDLAALSRRQALELSDSRWDYDVGRLVDFLEGHLGYRDEAAEEAAPTDNGRTGPAPGGPDESDGGGTTSGGAGALGKGFAAAGIGVAVLALVGYLALSPNTEPAGPGAPGTETPGPSPAPIAEVVVPEGREGAQLVPTRPPAEPAAGLTPSPPTPPAQTATTQAPAGPALEQPPPFAGEAEIDRLLGQASDDISAGRLTLPAGNNAFERYLMVLDRAPGHPEALKGLTRVVQRYTAMAEAAFAEDLFERGKSFLDRARQVASASPDLEGLGQKIETLAAAAMAGKRERAEAREHCLRECDEVAVPCREEAAHHDTSQCRAAVEKRCLKVYRKCRSSGDALIFGDVSADAQCTGQQVQCERKRMPRCERLAAEAMARCDRQTQACRDRCPG